MCLAAGATIAVTGQLDTATMAAIWADGAPDAPVSDARATTTAVDLRAAGSKTALAAWRGKVASGGVVALGVLGTAVDAVTSFFGDAYEKLEPVRTAFTDVPGWVWMGGASALSLCLYRQHQTAETAKLAEVQSGKAAG